MLLSFQGGKRQLKLRPGEAGIRGGNIADAVPRCRARVTASFILKSYCRYSLIGAESQPDTALSFCGRGECECIGKMTSGISLTAHATAGITGRP
jgi:hypothetical protein